VSNALANEPDVVVFDFLHAAVLRPPRMACPSVLFTHNVEAEIFERHADNARNPVLRSLWSGQHRKMRKFEAAALRKFDVVVAVSERDASRFREEYGVERPHVIPTGVDLDYYSYSDPKRSNDVVFLGSMDWLPNQDAIRYFMDEVWSGIARSVPSARMTVVGRAPPAGLVNRARSAGLEWSFTGFVDDVRPHVRAAAVCVIPIRIGGGTRLKVFEAMAMGIPVVSTSVGVEGLAIRDREHFLVADTPRAFERAVTELLENEAERIALARRARRFVQERYSHLIAARAFNAGCLRAMERSNLHAPTDDGRAW
jgi:glycosyltransferase involved in cell wall biosynthesis